MSTFFTLRYNCMNSCLIILQALHHNVSPILSSYGAGLVCKQCADFCTVKKQNKKKEEDRFLNTLDDLLSEILPTGLHCLSGFINDIFQNSMSFERNISKEGDSNQWWGEYLSALRERNDDHSESREFEGNTVFPQFCQVQALSVYRQTCQKNKQTYKKTPEFLKYISPKP